MFMSHKKRAIKLPSTSSSTSNHDENEDATGVHGDFGTESQFKGNLREALLGFKTETRLDRILL